MKFRPTGIATPWFGVQWELKDGDKAIAKQLVSFLEDRRLLFGDRHCEDELHCVKSALAIRGYLTDQIMNSGAGSPLITIMKALRGACRKFLDSAGPDAREFRNGGRYYGETDPFSLALGDLRTAFGYQLAVLLDRYGIEIEEDLASILPAADEPDSPLAVGRWEFE